MIILPSCTAAKRRSGVGWPTVDSASRVHYGGLAAASFVNNNTISGGAGGRTFITGEASGIVPERIIQDGTIRQVKVYVSGGAAVAGCKAKVFRPNGSNYDYVGESDTFTLSGSAGTKTFDLATPITGVEPGDVIGLYIPASAAIATTKTATGTPSIRWEAGDVTATNAFTSNTINNASLNVELLGTEPVACFTGDSIIEGHNAGSSWHGIEHGSTGPGPSGTKTSEIANKLRDLLTGTFDMEYQNRALGGQTFAWVRSTGIPNSRTAMGTGGFIVIHCGVNDVATARTWANVEADLDAIVALTDADSIHLFVDEILPWTAGNDTQAGTIRTWNGNLATWCAAKGATLISCHDAMGQTRGSTGQLDDLLTAYNQDGVHVTTAGVNALAALIQTALVNYYA